MKDPELISKETTRKIKAFLIPRILSVFCLTGVLGTYAALLGVALAWQLPDLRESCGDAVREDVMWVLFLAQLVVLVPASIYLCCRKWQQVEFDNASKIINRIAKMIMVTSIGGFLAIHARVLQEAFKWQYDGEFMGCAIMYFAGVLVLFPFLRKYRICQAKAIEEITVNDGVYKRQTWLYCGVAAATVFLMIASLAVFMAIS